MRSEREIMEKIDSLQEAYKKVANVGHNELKEDIAEQIDMLLWVIEDESGFDPLDERIDEILINLEAKER